MNNIAVLLLNVREAFCCSCCSPYQCETNHWGTTTLTVPLDIFPVPFPFSEHYWVYVHTYVRGRHCFRPNTEEGVICGKCDRERYLLISFIVWVLLYIREQGIRFALNLQNEMHKTIRTLKTIPFALKSKSILRFC